MGKSSGGFKPGQAGNPGGRPKDPEVQKLLRAIKKVQEDTGKNVYEEIVKMALSGNAKAISTVLKKLIPNRKQQTIDVICPKSIEIIITEDKRKK